MNDSWTPLWSQIVDSSLWDEEDCVVKVFITMLSKKDYGHIVRANTYKLARWSRKTETEVQRAISVLESPDTKRIEPQPFEGRRIQAVDGGWLILNGDKYRDMMSRIKKRAYKTNWQAEDRAWRDAVRAALELKQKPPGKEEFLRGWRISGPAGWTPLVGEMEHKQHIERGGTDDGFYVKFPHHAPRNPGDPVIEP